MTSTALARVVELNEGAKAIRRHSFEVSLRALGATAKNLRAGSELRGFVEVSAQMQSWSRSLSSAVDRVTLISTEQVRLVSDIVRRTRMLEIMELAAQNEASRGALAGSAERLREELKGARSRLKRLRDTLTDGLETLEQLGMMASALSRAALIEAASGNAEQRAELSLVSREFAQRADLVSDTIREIMRHNRGAML